MVIDQPKTRTVIKPELAWKVSFHLLYLARYNNKNIVNIVLLCFGCVFDRARYFSTYVKSVNEDYITFELLAISGHSGK